MKPIGSPTTRAAPTEATAHIKLRPGETIQSRYQPSFILFLQKSILVGLLTTIGFGFIPGFELSLLQRIGLAILLLAVFVIAFEEWRDWGDRRNDLWTLTNQRILLTNTRDTEELSWLNLNEIERVRGWMWWSVRLRGVDGKVTVMSFVGPTGQVSKEIKRSISTTREDSHV